MTISAADERTFILSDEIIAHIYSFFPPPNDHYEKPSKLVQPCKPSSMSLAWSCAK